MYIRKGIIPTVPKREFLVVLLFLGTFYLNLRKDLYKLVSKSLPQRNIKVIFQFKNQLSRLFNFKDSFPLYLPSNLLSNFPVPFAILLTYYGETESHLKVTAGEHISTSPLRGKRVNNDKKKSSVKVHWLLSGHVCSFDDFTVLNYKSNKFKRLIKESLPVTIDKPYMICNYLIDIFIKNVTKML